MPPASSDPGFAAVAARQRPESGELVLDHVAHFVDDLEAARATLEALGFVVTPRSDQTLRDAAGNATPAGSSNRCVMLEAGYLEILSPTADTPNARRLREAMARYRGVHILALGTPDAPFEFAQLARHGFAPLETVNLERDIGTADGGVLRARFSVQRVPPERMPEGRVQFCEQKTPEALWQPRWLEHANGAHTLAALVVASVEPHAAAARFMQFLGGDIVAGDDHTRLVLDRGEVVFGDAVFLAGATGETAVDIDLPWMAACAIRVADIARTQRFFEGAGLRYACIGMALQVPFPDALGCGCWLFCEADDDLPWRRDR